MISLKANPAGRGWLIGLIAVISVVGMGSQFFRSSHSVIAPKLMRDIGMAPSALAMLTGVYFIVGGLCQIPSGMLFDRFGPRRIMTVLLGIAALGAALFAVADDQLSLITARALMGVGFGAALVGNLVLCSRWFGPEKLFTMLGITMGLSQVGNLLTTSPMAVRVDAIG